MPSAPVTIINKKAPPTTVRTATGHAITSTASATLANHATLPPQACTGHIMPTFTNNLLSLGKLCDANCHVHLNKHALHVYNNAGTLVLRGDREPTGARLWRLNLQQTNLPLPHPLLSQPTYAATLVQHNPRVPTPRHIEPMHPTLIEDYDDERECAPTPAPTDRTPTTAPAMPAMPTATTPRTPAQPPTPAATTGLAPTPTPPVPNWPKLQNKPTTCPVHQLSSSTCMPRQDPQSERRGWRPSNKDTSTCGLASPMKPLPGTVPRRTRPLRATWPKPVNMSGPLKRHQPWRDRHNRRWHIPPSTSSNSHSTNFSQTIRVGSPSVHAAVTNTSWSRTTTHPMPSSFGHLPAKPMPIASQPTRPLWTA